MSNANPSRLGQVKGAGDVEAIWLKQFSGEVLTAFETMVKLRDRVRVRTIESGKSAQFPATFKAKASYHVPGTEITGQPIQHNEVTITLDDLLISDVFVAQIDELKNHYDVRGPYSQELGHALALFYDRMIAQNIINAARGGELFAGDGGGTVIQESDVSSSADFVSSAADAIAAINLAKQKMDEKDVPVDIMPVYACVKTPIWYLIANSDKNINRDLGGDGSLARQALRTISDIEIIKSNAPLFGRDVTPYNATSNVDGLVGAPASNAYALPSTYPAKYHADLTNTIGMVWTEPAAAVLQLLGLQMESEWDIRRQGTLMVAKMAVGAGPLRSKCAVELQVTP